MGIVWHARDFEKDPLQFEGYFAGISGGMGGSGGLVVRTEMTRIGFRKREGVLGW